MAGGLFFFYFIIIIISFLKFQIWVEKWFHRVWGYSISKVFSS